MYMYEKFSDSKWEFTVESEWFYKTTLWKAEGRIILQNNDFSHWCMCNLNINTLIVQSIRRYRAKQCIIALRDQVWRYLCVLKSFINYDKTN
jgi:hypothetical protein